MAKPTSQPLSTIINVSVQVNGLAAARPSFNQALFVGNSAHIANATRLKRYTENFAAEMAADGFLTTDPEYIAMQLYFGQDKKPTYGWAGLQDTTAMQTAAANAAGEDYVVGEVVTVVKAGASGGTLQITEVNEATGAVETFVVLTRGTGYSVAAGLATTGGSGTGFTVDISVIGETPLQAITACRAKNADWYVGVCLQAVKADHIAIAAWAQSVKPDTVYAYTTSDADVLAGTAANVGLALKALSYDRAIGQYTTTQGGTYPNNIYGICAILGYAMGQNTGLNNSAYTLKFKGETGITTEPLDSTDIANIEGANVNLYLSYAADSYYWFEQGVMADGTFFDQVLNRDMLVSDIILNIADVLNGAPKIPQTDAGQTRLINAVNAAAQKAVDRGYLAPGVFNPDDGLPILDLDPGESVPKGYLAQSPPYKTQALADRAARKAMPIYLVVCEAGAVHSITIGVYVQI